MNTLLRFVSVLVLLLGIAGCASTSSRISKNQAAFDAYPTEVQAKIRAGEVAVGFMPEQVVMALGKPDRVLQRTTATGVSDVWVYLAGGFRLGLGVGMGVGGGSSGVGGGVGAGTGSAGADEKLRVVFSGGRVTAVEQAKR
ncbi:MAG: hypothetical protein WC661_20650 [Opitutaceae bacterium]|jgi:hypothetical protein